MAVATAQGAARPGRRRRPGVPRPALLPGRHRRRRRRRHGDRPHRGRRLPGERPAGAGPRSSSRACSTPRRPPLRDLSSAERGHAGQASGRRRPRGSRDDPSASGADGAVRDGAARGDVRPSAVGGVLRTHSAALRQSGRVSSSRRRGARARRGAPGSTSPWLQQHGAVGDLVEQLEACPVTLAPSASRGSATTSRPSRPPSGTSVSTQRTYGLDHRPLIDSSRQPLGDRRRLDAPVLRQRPLGVVAVPVVTLPALAWRTTKMLTCVLRRSAAVAGGPLAHDEHPQPADTMPRTLERDHHPEAVGVGVGEVLGITAELLGTAATS